MIPLLTNLLLLICDGLALWSIRKRPSQAMFFLMLGPAAAFLLANVGRAAFGWTLFSIMQTQAWALFLHAPLTALVGAFLVKSRGMKLSLAALGLALVVVGVDAFWIEPRALEVSHVAIPTAGPRLKVALLTDIQTDHVGSYEERVFEIVREEQPELVLFAGDYIQTWTEEAFLEELPKLRALVASLHPRLGMVAVEGDVDDFAWQEIFRGAGVDVVEESRAIDFGEVVVTALTPEDSRSKRPPVQRWDKPHIVLGHSPDFALAEPPAELLVAGHVHGGQVRIPFFGPIFTFSRLPREQTSGLVTLAKGARLYTSRGVGMERMDAPRIRFLCRPELVFLEMGGR